jgi:hypothetical protein
LEKVLQIRENSLEELKEELAALKSKHEADKEHEKELRTELNSKLMEDRV